MEDVDIRYENGVIYMIKHKTDDTKEFYIGSSYNLKMRCWQHKSNCNNKTNCNNQNIKTYNLKVYKYIRDNGGWDAWDILFMYDYPCKNKYELDLEEQHAIKEYKSTLNTQVPCRTKKEWYKDNKEKLLQKKKEYHINNREKILQKNKEYYEANKEKIQQRKKEHFETNKEEILKQRAIKINCDICNAIVCKQHIARHKKANYCINYFKKN